MCLIVDDAGLGINAEEKDRASALLNTQGPVSITSLGSPPRVGFAVAGVLAARYGFKVSVDSVSPYGGVRAVILLPESLLTHDVPAPEAENSATTASEGSPSSPVTAPVAIVGTTAGGLPRRRRAVAVVPPAPSLAAEPDPVPEPEHSEVTATAPRLTAFARGTVRGRDTTTTEGSENQ